MIVKCKWCGKKIDARGMPRHQSAKHRKMILAKFRMDPAMILYGLSNGFLPPMQLALPAPNPLTVYSKRPLGYMAAPIPEHRRPKGYTLGYGYAQPWENLRVHRYLWERFL